MAEGVRITVTDLATGESESAEICNDYLLVTDGTYYLDGVQTHANGTHVLTVMRRKEGDKGRG